MKVLHYSDEETDDFMRLYSQCDLLISTGDLRDFYGLGRLSNKKTAMGVYGNHDTGTYMDKLGIINVHNAVYEYNGLKFGGWQGCLRYRSSPLMFTEEEAEIWAETFPYVDVLLLHAGPRGMLDKPSDVVHIGSLAVRRYVLDKQPKYVFCGHQDSDGFLSVGHTKIYRTYGARLITVEIDC